MAGGGDGDARLRGVFHLFERLRERPSWWRRERTRPLLFLLGRREQTERVAEILEERCERPPAPISRISAESLAEDTADVLREAKRELSRRISHPRGEPPLRFPLLEMALWLRDLREIVFSEARRPPAEASREEKENWRLVQELTDSSRADNDEFRRKALRRVIRRRGRDVLGDRVQGHDHEERGRFATFLTYLEQIAPIGVAVVALVSATAATTLDVAAGGLAASVGLSFVAGQILARTRGWYGLRRYGWFRKQGYIGQTITGDFLGFALEMIAPSRHGEHDEDGENVDLLLVAAFLEDLRRNHRRDIRRAAWARVRYPVLVFDHLTRDHVGCAFLRSVERVRVEAQADGYRRFDPLVIIVGIDPAEPADSDVSDGPLLIDALARAIAVKVSDGAPVNVARAAELWSRYTGEQRRIGALGSRRELRVDLTRGGYGGELDPARPARRRPWATHPALPWIVMSAILGASATVVGLKAVENCSPPAVRWLHGQCIGITDGSFAFDDRLERVEDRIADDNGAVMRSGKPYVTIVYVGPMTADPSVKNPTLDLLSGAQGELVGISMAQRRFNEASQELRIRVLLANAGAKMRDAGTVARQVRERADHDKHIVGVIGFEQSRTQTQQAVTELSRSALPMIGTANSYDGTAYNGSSFSPYYFRLAPPNDRLAEHATFWARGGDMGRPAKTATVFYDGDPNDLYSRNLAEDFRRRFGAAEVRMEAYADPSQVPDMVRRACVNPSDLFYYAGRSDEFLAFSNVLTNTACGGQRTLLADDEIAKFVADHAAEIGQNDAYRLFYTPLALKEAWSAKWVGAQARQRQFFADYDNTARDVSEKGESPLWRPSATRAAVSYDAVLALEDVAQGVYADGRTQPTPGSILTALIEPDSGAVPQGVSGVLTFGPRRDGHQVQDKPVLLATVLENGSIDVREVCGRLVTTEQHPAHCPPGDH